MLHWFDKKKRVEKHPTPPWVKWLVLGFIFYAVFIGAKTDQDGAPTSINQAFTNIQDSVKTSFDLEHYKNKILPDTGTSLYIKDMEYGQGNPIICGQDVKIAYEVLRADGTAVDDAATKEKPLAFRIGGEKVLPVFEQGIIGMQVGGRRSIIASPDLAYGSRPQTEKELAQATLQFNIELLAAKPDLPNLDDTPYRIAEVASGGGHTILCGQPVNVRVTVWDVKGKKIFSSGEELLSFIPGASNVFMGLEQGVIGMPRGGLRLLAVPPPFQNTMHGNEATIKIPLPKKETVLVDVEALP